MEDAVTEMPAMECSGCGDRISMSDPSFSDWWVEHGKCLREKYGEPRSEIDHNVRKALS